MDVNNSLFRKAKFGLFAFQNRLNVFMNQILEQRPSNFPMSVSDKILLHGG